MTLIKVEQKSSVDLTTNQSILGALAFGRKSIEAGESYQLREPSIPYNARFGVKKGDRGHENTYFWNVTL